MRQHRSGSQGAMYLSALVAVAVILVVLPSAGAQQVDRVGSKTELSARARDAGRSIVVTVTGEVERLVGSTGTTSATGTTGGTTATTGGSGEVGGGGGGAATTGTTTGLPLTTTGLPVTTTGLPVTTTGLPVTTTGLPVTTTGLPLTTTGLPIEGMLSQAGACGGRVTITVRARRRTISTRRVRVNQGCKFRKTTRVRKSRIPRSVRKRVRKLVVVTRFRGNATVRPSRDVERVRVKRRRR